jgi:DNA-binding CsgD family transcriptional regulator
MENKNSYGFRNGFSENAVITAENVKDFGEVIAITALKKVMVYTGKSLGKLYAGLIHDVFDYKDVSDTYSDGYDIAGEAICFLCGHIGKRLEDEFKTDRKGRVITIKQACYRDVFNFIDKQRMHIYNTESYDNLTYHEEPYVDFKDNQDKDYSTIDKIIKRMHLSQGQLDTLNCYMAGMTFVEIAQFLSVNLSTVWRRRLQLQQKYIATCGN